MENQTENRPSGNERIPVDKVRAFTVSANFSHSYILDNYKSCPDPELKGMPFEWIANRNIEQELDNNRDGNVNFENRGKENGFGIKQGKEQILPLFISNEIAMNMSKDDRNRLRSAVVRDGHFSTKMVTPVFNEKGKYISKTGRKYDLQVLAGREDIIAAEQVGLAVLDNSLPNKYLPFEDRIVQHYVVQKNPSIGDVVYFKSFVNNVSAIGGVVKKIDKF
jgi:hypothetical protein